MTANLERRRETLRLAHEHDFIILEGILLAFSAGDIDQTSSFKQMTRTFTCTMVKPPGTRRILRSNSSNPSSGESSDLTAFQKFCRPGCASGLLRVQNCSSTPLTLMYVCATFFLVAVVVHFTMMNDGITHAERGGKRAIVFADPSDYLEAPAVMGLRRIPETYRARVRFLSDEARCFRNCDAKTSI